MAIVASGTTDLHGNGDDRNPADTLEILKEQKLMLHDSHGNGIKCHRNGFLQGWIKLCTIPAVI